MNTWITKKHFVVGSVAVVVFAVTIAVFGFTVDNSGALGKRRSLIVRSIGHRLLLYSGDASSRVLPVKQLSKGIFEVEFESSFSFSTDTLVKIARTEIATRGLAADYMVSVFNCTKNEVVYGFEVTPLFKDITPCLGRVQPKGCYKVQVAFMNFEASRPSSSSYSFYAMILIGVSLVVVVGRSWLKREETQVVSEITGGVSIGKYLFSAEGRVLKINSETVELSDKESRILSILAARQNQLIDREELLKKVWEDDGVFTGRSLDVFISKLRKKLKEDPSVQIVNVHGKGYRLTT